MIQHQQQMMIGYVNNLPRVVVSQERVTDRQTGDTAPATDDDGVCEQLAQGCCEQGACDRQTDRRMIQQQQQMMIGYVNNLPRVVVSREHVTDRRMIQQQQQMMIGYVNKLPRVVVSRERVTDRQTD